jgi:ubiquinone/menaquinone biosynthesis C-methylase UbiE
VDGIAHFIDPGRLEGPNRRFARYYDRLAPFYSAFSKLALLPFGGERAARMEILDRLELNGGRILEVAIGNGVNLPYLFESQHVGDVFAVDISLGQLLRCQRLVLKRGWPVELFLGMAESLPFKADTFDGVFHIGGINFFTGKRQAIDEMIRVARPGCRIVIADEAERLAKTLERVTKSTLAESGIGTGLVNLLPDGAEEAHVQGIWKFHGRHHGYCLEFRKPE